MVAVARRIATRVLHRVAHDGAWAAPALDAELRRATATRSDAALATQIVYGVLRVLPTLDATIQRKASRPVRVDSWTHAAMAAAVFQLLHLSRIPAHAAVNDAIDLVREQRGQRVAGFANAVLRKVARERPDEPRPPTSLVVPAWLDRKLRDSIGDLQTEALLGIAGDPRSVDVRICADTDLEQVAEQVQSECPEADVAKMAFSTRGLRLTGVGNPRLLGPYLEGKLAVQEEGAQVIGLLVGARPSERVLDACAGRGGKTAQLVEAVGAQGEVVATDLHEHRLEQIAGELDRLRLPSSVLETAAVDATVGWGAVSGLFDRVLVDAPCTGLGTLRRRPEILQRSEPGDAARMGERQRLLLQHAARLVAPGGTLLYAVCSPLREEGEQVVAQVDLAGFRPVERVPFGLKSLRFGSTGTLALGPWVEGSGPWADAYQVYVWAHVGCLVDRSPPQR